MADIFKINITEEDRLHAHAHGVPKCVTKHPNGKQYYVDISRKELVEYDPNSKQVKAFPAENNGEREFVTALGLNEDGSFVVARQSGVYYFKPDAPEGQEWLHICEIPGVNKDVRPNNGTMIACADGKTRFFMGTATVSGAELPNASPPSVKEPLGGGVPGKLFVLEPKAGGSGFELKQLVEGFITLNAVSGQVIDGRTKITFADSSPGQSKLLFASYSPFSGVEYDRTKDSFDFKSGKQKAENGRPDGTSPVLINDRPCIAVAAIDSNEIRLFDLKTKAEIGRVTLPKDMNKPTMPTFTTNENGETVCNVSAFSAPNPSGDTGKIYSKVMPPQFKAVEHVGTYPGYEKAKAAAAHVSGKAGGAAIG